VSRVGSGDTAARVIFQKKGLEGARRACERGGAGRTRHLSGRSFAARLRFFTGVSLAPAIDQIDSDVSHISIYLSIYLAGHSSRGYVAIYYRHVRTSLSRWFHQRETEAWTRSRAPRSTMLRTTRETHFLRKEESALNESAAPSPLRLYAYPGDRTRRFTDAASLNDVIETRRIVSERSTIKREC